jgi:multimeric flavodoxin WrbA
MKVVAFNGSARKKGNTEAMIRRVFEALENEDIRTELVQLSGKALKGCIACMKCYKNKDQQCAVTDDDMNFCIGNWNMGFGLEKEEVKSDKEGMETMKHLGENMAWLMKKIIE